ncbi:MAG: hypothetical protein IT435_14475 [Phycisphaerales bacterium]|nr:hypothetical protein [Phycisphaerales bacterium]
MTAVDRQGRPRLESGPVVVHANGVERPQRTTQAIVCRLEAKWLISRRAVRASRPDLGFGIAGGDLSLLWQVEVEIPERSRTGTPGLIRADCRIAGSAHESAATLECIDARTPDVQLLLQVDAGQRITTVELRRGQSSLVLVSLGILPGELAASTSPARIPLSYASTPILGDTPPRGLGISGGRYELESAAICRLPT